MSHPLPILRGPSTALYPFVQKYVANTGISNCVGGQTARFVRSPILLQFEFQYKPISQADKNTLKSFFNTVKGAAGIDLSLSTDISYSNMSLDSDEFSATEEGSTLYGAGWTLSQVVPQNLSPGTSGAAYPTLASGAICQRPYTQSARWQTITSKVRSGPKRTFAEFGSTSNFPAAQLMSWRFQEPMLLDSDVTNKVNHFLANWGDCFPFTFTDEDGNTYSNVYYGSNELIIERSGVNENAITTTLVQMN